LWCTPHSHKREAPHYAHALAAVLTDWIACAKVSALPLLI
jgi:hypothetical protein